MSDESMKPALVPQVAEEEALDEVEMVAAEARAEVAIVVVACLVLLY